VPATTSVEGGLLQLSREDRERAAPKALDQPRPRTPRRWGPENVRSASWVDMDAALLPPRRTARGSSGEYVSTILVALRQLLDCRRAQRRPMETAGKDRVLDGRPAPDGKPSPGIRPLRHPLFHVHGEREEIQFSWDA